MSDMPGSMMARMHAMNEARRVRLGIQASPLHEPEPAQEDAPPPEPEPAITPIDRVRAMFDRAAKYRDDLLEYRQTREQLIVDCHAEIREIDEALAKLGHVVPAPGVPKADTDSEVPIG